MPAGESNNSAEYAMPQLSDLLALATAYQNCCESSAIHKTLVQHLGSVMGVRAVLLWTRGHCVDGLTCGDSWFQPGSPFRPCSEAVTDGFLFQLLQTERAQRFGKGEIDPEALTHLGENDRERLTPPSLSTPITRPIMEWKS